MSKIPTLGQFYEGRLIPQQGDLGLELEVEFTRVDKEPSVKPWITKTDGSLRYAGYEFVSNGALHPKDVAHNLRNLCDYLRTQKGLIEDSPRTSYHVHQNVMDMTPPQILNAMCLYWLVENSLYDAFCTPSRKGNLFCLRLCDARGIIPIINNSITVDTALPFYSLRGDHYRYGGLNINALIKFGSLEARGKDGRIDYPSMLAWTMGFSEIIKAGTQFKNPEELMDRYFHHGRGKDDKFLQFLYDLGIKSPLKHLEKVIPSLGAIKNETTINTLAYTNNWERYEENLLRIANNKPNTQKLRPTTPRMRGPDIFADIDINAVRDVLVRVNPAPTARVGAVPQPRENRHENFVIMDEVVNWNDPEEN